MVSVIIVSFNTEKLLRRCLASFFRYYKDKNFEVIVVDNASTDETVSMVSTEFPNVQLVRNAKNEGFGKGVNQGASVAKGEYLLFFNSDATFIDSSFLALIEELKENTKTGVVGGKLTNELGATSRSCGQFPTVLGVFAMLFLGAMDREEGSSHRKIVDWVSGGFMLVRASLFRAIKGFDSEYFMYYEDVDLCYRIKKEGFDTVYLPKAVAAHTGQGSSSRSFAIINIYKGLRLFMKKHRTGLEYVFVNLFLIKKALLSLCFGLLTGDRQLVATYKKAMLA